MVASDVLGRWRGKDDWQLRFLSYGNKSEPPHILATCRTFEYERFNVGGRRGNSKTNHPRIMFVIVRLIPFPVPQLRLC